jgi:histidyl-tRNA synthetase
MKNKCGPLRGFKYPTSDECQIFNFIREEYFKLVEEYNMKIIQPPILARKEIFVSLGENSDVVRKELYSFTQKDGEEVCLVPEYTRVFVDQMVFDNSFEGAYACFGSCFRYERPQKGRYRSFTQINTEFIGSKYYMKDIELFCFINDLLKKLGVKNYIININSIGTIEDRRKYEKALEEYFSGCLSKLSENSRIKFERKAFLRMLDCKDEEDLVYLKASPKITDYLCEESKITYEKIKQTLRELSIDFVENPFLVRGLDYYNDLVFEYTCEESLGAQNSILGGGRYDGLFTEVIGKPVAAVGFAIGVERIIHIIENNYESSKIKRKKISIIPIEETENLYGVKIFQLLKKEFKVDILYENTVSNRLKISNKTQCDYVILVGSTEKSNGTLILKNMINSEEKTLFFSNLIDFLKNK